MNAIATAEIVKPADPGIYPGLAAEIYHRLPFASASRLGTLFNGTPAHVRNEMVNPKAPTDALIFGSACHIATLQPELLSSTIIVADECMATLKTGARANEACGASGVFRSPDGSEWRCRSHNKTLQWKPPVGIMLSSEDLSRCQLMRDAVMNHSSARRLIEASREEIESSVIFDDPATGQRCKMRPDMLSASLGAIFDLKTTECASPAAFIRTVRDYGYHRQAAFYQRGLRIMGRDADVFAFIVVEKQPPFGVACYEIDAEWMRVGALECDELLETFAACERSGVWPGYSDRIETIAQRSWDAKQAREKYGDRIEKYPVA